MVEYKKATINDCSALAHIRMDFLVEATSIISQNEKDIIYKNNEQYFLNSIKNGSFASWLAIDGTQIIATSGVSFYTLPPNKSCPNGHVAYIGNMYTYPKYRNKGIATKLFELTVDEAKKHGCSKILLNATEMGRSIYEKYGFRDTKNEMVYYIL